MNNRTFLAYSAAGVAAALAITAISASAFEGGDGSSRGSGTTVAPIEQAPVADGIEYVYVDTPPASDDEWEDDEHEEHEDRGEGGSLLSWLRGGEHDDDD